MARRILNLDLVLGTVIVLIFVGLCYKKLPIFEAMESYVYNAEMKFAQPEQQSAPKIILIDIDDKSFSKLGSWPWPRDVVAEMINNLTKSGATLIGLNIPFIEKEPNKSIVELKLFAERLRTYPFGKEDPMLTSWILENFKQMEQNLDNDGRLVETVQQSGNVILPVLVQFGGDPKGVVEEDEPILFENFLYSFQVSSSLQKRLSTHQLSLPFPELTQTVSGLGHGNLTFKKSMAGRSHPMFIAYRGSLLPSFPLRLAIAHLNQQPKQVLVGENQIRLKGYTIPTIDGEMLIKFQNGQDAFPRYSFSDILQAKKIPPIFDGKIVVIGFNSSESRTVNTPISPHMSEGEFIAHILDNILTNSFILRLPFMFYIELLAILLLGGFASYFFPQMGQLSRLGWVVGLTVFTLLAGIALFVIMGIWFKTTYVAGCLVAVYLVVSARQLLAAEGIAKESIETNRLLGLSFQSQGFLDLAFEKFQKLPLNEETKDLIFNLGREYERKRMYNKALTVYEYLNRGGGYKNLDDHIIRLREHDKSSTLGSHGKTAEESILADSSGEEKPKIGRYEILGELGKGSMGLVYKAQDPNINRLLAIKTIRFSDEFDDEVIEEIKERFFREAEIAGQLSHPSIVTIYDVGEHGDLTYMAMEFLEGDDLENFVSKDNLLPFRQILDVLAKVSDAVDYAHKAGVIHRDIKPANIMVLNNGGVKVTDFGIAKAMSSSRTRTGVILGTPNYMSPEQIMGQKIDARSDIFSVGVLFFQMLTGELPFHGENLSGLLYQITKEKHPSVRDHNPKIPKVCEQIIDRALSKNPKDRFNTAGELVRVIRLVAQKLDQIRGKNSGKKKAFSKA
jgi:serine/threonine-protein kinase